MRQQRNIKYVFTDMFDTFVSRNIEPEYVKKIWSNNIIKYFDLNMSALDLYHQRYIVEIELGEKAKKNSYDCEIRYNDIMEEIYKYLNLNISLKDFIKIARTIELDIEKKVLFVNKDIINKLLDYKKDGKKIYCITDIYFDKKMILELLKYLEVDSIFDDVFVSSEYLLNKLSGRLYEHVINTLNVNPEDCLMIGDNYHKDYEAPKKYNINSEFVDRKDQYQKYSEFLNNNNPDNIIPKIKELSLTNNECFNNIVFSLYRFTEKLFYKLKVNNTKEVFFLAREGEYLKTLFDYYNQVNNGDITSHYLYVSRKATYLPSLKELDKEDFSYLLDQYSFISIREFLGSLNFDDKEIEDIRLSISNSLDIDKKISNFKKSNELRKIKKSKVFRSIFEKNRKEQKSYFKKYITQKTKSKNIVVVDVGWNGSIQNNIQNILGEAYNISGEYLGLVLRDIKYAGKKEGLIFTNCPEESQEFKLYYENRTIYEIILGASHGSTNKYSISEDGTINPILFTKEEEKEIYTKVVLPSQEKMFITFKSLCDLLVNKYYDNIKVNKLFNKIHYNLLFTPTKEQLEFFDKLYHYENFGVFEFTTFNNKSKIGFKKYLKENIKFFLRYKIYFEDAFWPVLKLYNYKLHLPYWFYKYYIYFKLKKHRVF